MPLIDQRIFAEKIRRVIQINRCISERTPHADEAANNMSKKSILYTIKVALIASSIGSLYFVPWSLVHAWILPLPNSLQAQADEAVKHGFEGIVIYVDQAGKPPRKVTSGWHDREAEIPANPDALFKIASISKLYDAVAVTKLVHDEKLDLDGVLTAYLPELKGRIQNAEQITLSMLIQHRSGIPNFTDAPGFWGDTTKSYQECLDLILDQPARFTPGQDYEYCNTNYLLLNRIMDDALGYSNFAYIQGEILDPLGLEDTYGKLQDVPLDRVMGGYHIGYPGNLKADEHGMVSTAQDVGRFVRALNNGTVFEAGERQTYASVYEFEHSGWVPGYQSFAVYHSDLDAVVVVFYNTTDEDLLYWNLAEIINSRIAEVLNSATVQ